jgi:hypothetical protein
MPTQTLQLTVPVSTTAPQNLDDVALAAWLEQCRRAGHAVGYLHSQSLCKVFDTTAPSTQLHPADPDKKSKAMLKKLAQENLLLQHELLLATLTAANAVDPSWPLAPAAPDEIADLVDGRLRALGRIGRGVDISPPTAWKVWTDAGGCCMFEGCGANLSTIPLYTSSAKISYLAHIIASDPNGPRGTLADSHRFSDDADNIMLMCDAHHRLIDSFATAEYPAARLNSMRLSHVNLVRSYMSSLAYPRVKAITLHADLAGIPTYFQESDLIGAILDTRRAMSPGVEQHIRRTQRDDRRTPEFWVQYLHEHQLQIQRMVSSFNAAGGANTGELAIFPLHHTATLILAGRIIGEARPVRVFQYHRQRRTWCWDRNATPQPPGTITVNGLTPQQAHEVLISIELTANLDVNALPAGMADETSSGRMPWVRIQMPNPAPTCIQHPDDLDQFMSVARQAIIHIQDVMHAQRVHLIAISPASTVFCFGQMLQAGHHPIYTIYDRPGRDSPFVEAFSISGHDVTARAGAQTTNIALR